MELKQSDEQFSMNLSNELDKGYSNKDGFHGYEELKDDDFMNQFEEQPYVTSMPEPAKKGFKEIVSLVLILLLFGGVAIWCLVSGTKGLFGANTHTMDEAFTNVIKGDVYEGTISYISPEFCELKHTINLIPAGTEHFYLMFSPDGTKVIPIRASKKWDTQFVGDSVQTVSLQERGIVREMDYKVRKELSSIVTAFAEEGIQVEPALYIDLNTNKLSVLQIIIGISIILCAVYFAITGKRADGTIIKEALHSPITLFMTVLLFITFGGIIYLLNMVGF